MYIIKNALRCIGRSKGRNVLIGIIALVIAISACIGLSIRQASVSAQENALAGMSVTGTISIDPMDIMDQIGGSPGSGGGFGGFGGFDKDAFAEMMGEESGLTIDEYLKYADASTVQSFYYTLSAYFDGSDIEPYSESSSSSNSSSSPSQNGFPMGGGRGPSGDFSIVGYSSYEGMTEFVNGTSTVTSGTMFALDTVSYDCVISDVLATYNTKDNGEKLSVGDTIVLNNPSVSTETYTLTIVGTYSTSTNSGGSMVNPANKIYMSATALQAILDASESVATTSTNDFGMTESTKVQGELEGVYVFENADGFEIFKEEIYEMGLDEKYSVSSPDIDAYEASLAPLNTLSEIAGWFLIVILIIGGVILVVLNIFSVRERKYEVGVLTAMGMKKWKVAAQFMCEILVVTMIAVVIGAAIGAVCSVPVTNALLEGQISSQSNQQNKLNDNFKLPDGMSFPSGMGGGMPSGGPSNMPDMGGGRNPIGNMFDDAANYITEVDSAMNLTVVFQMIGVGLLLTLIASAGSVLFIMRYDPLKILANRD